MEPNTVLQLEERADSDKEERNQERPPRLCLGTTASDDQVDLISISRNSMIMKARESVGKRRARRDDLYFQLDPTQRRFEEALLNWRRIERGKGGWVLGRVPRSRMGIIFNKDPCALRGVYGASSFFSSFLAFQSPSRLHVRDVYISINKTRVQRASLEVSPLISITRQFLCGQLTHIYIDQCDTDEKRSCIQLQVIIDGYRKIILLLP